MSQQESSVLEKTDADQSATNDTSLLEENEDFQITLEESDDETSLPSLDDDDFVVEDFSGIEQDQEEAQSQLSQNGEQEDILEDSSGESAGLANGEESMDDFFTLDLEDEPNLSAPEGEATETGSSDQMLTFTPHEDYLIKHVPEAQKKPEAQTEQRSEATPSFAPLSEDASEDASDEDSLFLEESFEESEVEESEVEQPLQQSEPGQGEGLESLDQEGSSDEDFAELPDNFKYINDSELVITDESEMNKAQGEKEIAKDSETKIPAAAVADEPAASAEQPLTEQPSAEQPEDEMSAFEAKQEAPESKESAPETFDEQEPPTEEPPTEEPLAEQSGDDKGKGFFADMEDEDETLALSDDELGEILNDVTEEEDSEMDLDDSLENLTGDFEANFEQEEGQKPPADQEEEVEAKQEAPESKESAPETFDEQEPPTEELPTEEPPTEEPPTEEPLAEEPLAEQSGDDKGKGFFADMEDEDETLALSDDELGDVLNDVAYEEDYERGKEAESPEDTGQKDAGQGDTGQEDELSFAELDRELSGDSEPVDAEDSSSSDMEPEAGESAASGEGVESPSTLEQSPELEAEQEGDFQGEAETEESTEEDNMTLDLDSLDLDLDEQEEAQSEQTEGSSSAHEAEQEEIFAEDVLSSAEGAFADQTPADDEDFDILSEPEKGSPEEDAEEEEDNGFAESGSQTGAAQEEESAIETSESGRDEDSVTLDMDELDIDLAEDEPEGEGQTSEAPSGEAVASEEDASSAVEPEDFGELSQKETAESSDEMPVLDEWEEQAPQQEKGEAKEDLGSPPPPEDEEIVDETLPESSQKDTSAQEETVEQEETVDPELENEYGDEFELEEVLIDSDRNGSEESEEAELEPQNWDVREEEMDLEDLPAAENESREVGSDFADEFSEQISDEEFRGKEGEVEEPSDGSLEEGSAEDVSAQGEDLDDEETTTLSGAVVDDILADVVEDEAPEMSQEQASAMPEQGEGLELPHDAKPPEPAEVVSSEMGPASEQEENAAPPLTDHEALVGKEKMPSRDELKKMLSYLDGLFENLPEDVVKQFARSEYFDLYMSILRKLEME